MGSPAVPTLAQALNKFPQLRKLLGGLTAASLKRHNPTSLATAKGHPKRTRHGLRTTRDVPDSPLSPPPKTIEPRESLEDWAPTKAQQGHAAVSVAMTKAK